MAPVSMAPILHIKTGKAHILYMIYTTNLAPNIDALNSDTNTLFLSIHLSVLILNSQCVDVANKGIDIWYMAHIIWGLYYPPYDSAAF